MRFAIMTELFAPSMGGQELFFEGIARSLIAAGHEVEVFCIGHEANLPTSEIVNGVPVQRYPIAPGYKQPTFSWRKA